MILRSVKQMCAQTKVVGDLNLQVAHGGRELSDSTFYMYTFCICGSHGSCASWAVSFLKSNHINDRCVGCILYWTEFKIPSQLSDVIKQ